MGIAEKTTKLGETLRKLRVEHGMTQSQLADQLRVTRQTISGWERGKANQI